MSPTASPTASSPASSPADRPSRCPRCGASFGCGVDSAACWCTTLPPIDPTRLAALDAPARAALGLPEGRLPAACLCPACLAEVGTALAGR